MGPTRGGADGRSRAAEFAALDVDQALPRLRAGQTTLSAAGLPTVGFTPPGWLASPGAVTALRQEGFRYLTDAPRLARPAQRSDVPRVRPLAPAGWLR